MHIWTGVQRPVQQPVAWCNALEKGLASLYALGAWVRTPRLWCDQALQICTRLGSMLLVEPAAKADDMVFMRMSGMVIQLKKTLRRCEYMVCSMPAQLHNMGERCQRQVCQLPRTLCPAGMWAASGLLDTQACCGHQNLWIHRRLLHHSGAGVLGVGHPGLPSGARCSPL